MTEAAPWLKAMENGGLGEARAKAFLMDRFWVLERSVDIEGADYLVQRRLTRHNFMDRDPPRLGVVQVKFIQNGATSISVHKSYVCDDKGSPYNEFFLLVFHRARRQREVLSALGKGNPQHFQGSGRRVTHASSRGRGQAAGRQQL